MDVAFAVVPFADVARPSIGVSLLKAGLARFGFSSRIHYFNIEFAEAIDEKIYSYISDHTPADSMSGEWLFAHLVFGDQLPPEHDYVRTVLSFRALPDMVRSIVDARSKTAQFVDRCAQTLAAAGAPIVAFTTTFHQTCACLAIAKRLKEMPNPPTICFGGANCEGEMGLQMIRSFPWIDYVCTREGDSVFPQFVSNFLHKGEPGELPGFLQRASESLTYPEMIEDMDSLPVPDYDDYVEAMRGSSLNGKVKPEMQIEAARGCWWGAKHHCTFCGLNGDTMRYRSKSPERVYSEIKHIYTRYGYKRIDSVDNILDHRYLTSVFPRLAAEGIELEMFYEVKANLKRSQLVAMRRGGITMIQPGIESFSDQVLHLMDKGVSGAQNVQLLKWAEETGVSPSWNVLAGFPGESPSEYDRMAALIPLLAHLEPPTGCEQIRLDRFSPLFNKAAEAGLCRVRPTRAYYYVFPLGRRELARLAYFFDFDYTDGRKPESYIVGVQNEIIKWRNARFQADPSQRPKLDAWLEQGAIRIMDTRPCAVAPEHLLADLDAAAFLACDVAQSLRSVQRQLAPDYSAAEVERSIRKLIDDRLLAEVGNHIVSLPVLRNRPADPMETELNVHAAIPTAAHTESLLRIL